MSVCLTKNKPNYIDITLYKEYFPNGIAEKTVRISGVLGPNFRPLRRDNIVANVDPDVKIESKTVNDARNYNILQQYRGFVQMVAQA